MPQGTDVAICIFQLCRFGTEYSKVKVRPCRFAMTLRISEYFCIGNTAFAVTKIKKSLSQKGACQKLAGRRGGVEILS